MDVYDPHDDDDYDYGPVPWWTIALAICMAVGAVAIAVGFVVAALTGAT